MAASKHTHARDNAVTLVWGSLRLAPIIQHTEEIMVQVTLPNGFSVQVHCKNYLVKVSSQSVYSNFRVD